MKKDLHFLIEAVIWGDYGSVYRNLARNSSTPNKPYLGFPLHTCAPGQWAKAIREGYYFGKWDGWQATVRQYVKRSDTLQAGLPAADPVTPCNSRRPDRLLAVGSALRRLATIGDPRRL